MDFFQGIELHERTGVAGAGLVRWSGDEELVWRVLAHLMKDAFFGGVFDGRSIWFIPAHADRVKQLAEQLRAGWQVAKP